MAIGDDSGSRLYWALVDPGLADSADCSFHEYEGTGSFYTSFSCEPEQTEENLAIVAGRAAAVQQRRHHRGRAAAGQEQDPVARGPRQRTAHGTHAWPSAWHWTYLHEYRTVDDELKAFEAVTTKAIREVLDRYPLDRVTTLALGPLAALPAPA